VLDHLDDPATAVATLTSGTFDAALRNLRTIAASFDESEPPRVLRIDDLLALGEASWGAGRGGRPDPRLAELELLARRYLTEIARTRAVVLAARDALAERSRPPAEPALRGLFLRLDAARERLALGVTRRPLGVYRSGELQLVEGPLRLTTNELDVLGRPVRSVSVVIRLDDDPIAPRCICARLPGTTCDHQLVALDAAIDLLRDPGHPLRARIAQAISVPGWSRFLAAFGESLARVTPSEAPTDTRLVFRVEPRLGGLSVEAALQKPGKRGGWSSGQRIAPSELALRRDLHRDPRDARAIAELCAGPDGHGHTLRPQEQLFRLFTALIGHPRVVFADRSDVSVKVVRARLRLILEPSPTGIVPALALGDRRATAGELLLASDRSEHLILADEAAGTILLASLDERARALLAALDRFPVSFPEESHDALLRQLQPLQESLSIELPPSLSGDPLPPDLRPVVRISPLAGSPTSEVSVLFRPLAGGPLFSPGEGPAQVLHVLAGKRVAAHRAFADELSLAHALVAQLPLPAASRPQGEAEEGDAASAWHFLLEGEEALLDLLAALRSQGESVIVEWPDESRRLTLGSTAKRGDLRVQVSDRRDWFGVEGELSVDGATVPLSALLEAIGKGRRYVEVGPLRFAAIEDDLRKRVAAAGDVLFPGRHGLELGLPGAALIADLVDDAGQLDAVLRFRELVQRIDASRALEPALPAGLRAELRHYQLDGFRWLSRLASWGLGGCLADDMGLGKTVQALALLLQRAPLGPALVVAPTSVVSNWADEAARFAPGLRVVVYRGAARAAMLAEIRPGDLLLTSYGLLTRDAEALAGARFATLILDEAQAIKNALTRRARAVRDLHADFRVALTGTPVENHLGELWSLMRVLAPGLFGSWDHFRARFAGPIERARDPERSAALARTLRPFILRRTKAEVTPELPERTEISRLVDPSAAERTLYQDARRAALAAISSGEGDARFILLAALTRLRRLACHPRLIDPDSKVASTKLAALLEIVDELRETGHRALIFSQFTTHLALVREALDRASITYAYLDGSTPVEERSKRIAAFQAGSADLFLISLKAGGTGLNLTAADYVIHLDPWWNPAVEDQATDRAHRIGQTRPVTVIRLISRGTIEESVLSLHGDKRALSASLFDEEGSPSRLSVEDLASLIREGTELAVGEDEAGDALGEELMVDEGVEAPSKAPKKAAPGKGRARKPG
jgi:superfamily II DNA or RNA helicase